MSIFRRHQPSAAAEFLHEHEGDPRLTAKFVPALPSKVLSLIRKRAPDFLSRKQCAFEKSLRDCCATGIRNGIAVYSETLEERFSPENEFPRYHKTSSGQAIVSKLVEAKILPKTEHVPLLDLGDAATESATRDREIRRAYCAWLWTHAPFREELHVAGQSDPFTLSGEKALRALCDRWFLQSLTGDLIPEPLGIRWSHEAARGKDGKTKSQGIAISLPWPFFKSKELSLSGLFEAAGEVTDLSHLEGWFARTGFSFARYSQMLDLYVYWHLGLAVRYPDQLTGHRQLLEEVFAEYWTGVAAPLSKHAVRGDQNVTLIRRKLSSRLRQPWPGPDRSGQLG